MGLKINHIIILENNEQYIILNEAMYYGKKYFLAMGLNAKREVIPSEVVFLEESISGVEVFVSKVIEKDLIAILTNLFKEQVKAS